MTDLKKQKRNNNVDEDEELVSEIKKQLKGARDLKALDKIGNLIETNFKPFTEAYSDLARAYEIRELQIKLISLLRDIGQSGRSSFDVNMFDFFKLNEKNNKLNSLFNLLKYHHFTFDMFLKEVYGREITPEFKKEMMNKYYISAEEVFQLGHEVLKDLFAIDDGPKKIVEQHLAYNPDADLKIEPRLTIRLETGPMFQWTDVHGRFHEGGSTEQKITCKAIVKFFFDIRFNRKWWEKVFYAATQWVKQPVPGLDITWRSTTSATTKDLVTMKIEVHYTLVNEKKEDKLSRSEFTLELLKKFEDNVADRIPQDMALMCKAFFFPSTIAYAKPTKEKILSHTQKETEILTSHYKAMNDNIFTDDFFRGNSLMQWSMGFSTLIDGKDPDAIINGAFQFKCLIPPERLVKILSAETTENYGELRLNLSTQHVLFNMGDYLTENQTWDLFDFSSKFTPASIKGTRLKTFYLKHNVATALSTSHETLRLTSLKF